MAKPMNGIRENSHRNPPIFPRLKSVSRRRFSVYGTPFGQRSADKKRRPRGRCADLCNDRHHRFSSASDRTGVFDTIAQFSGAGVIVPISGFANSMVAPAIEYKKEGPVLGVGAKLFSIAGPVLVCGITAATIIGVIYWLIGLL